MMNSIDAILFDLDGTLLDTAQDLIAALYSLNEPILLPQDKHSELRAAASHGCRGLIKTGLNIHHEDERYPLLSEKLLNHYEKHLLDNTKFFPGMEEVLVQLDNANIPWGIVTNKPDKYTQLILSGLKIVPQCVISGDSLQNRKPHPEPLLHACNLLKKSPQNCLYVGDTQTDVIASKAAGLPSLVALYGYIAESDDPKNWQASGYISHPKEILDWIA